MPLMTRQIPVEIVDACREFENLCRWDLDGARGNASASARPGIGVEHRDLDDPRRDDRLGLCGRRRNPGASARRAYHRA